MIMNDGVSFCLYLPIICCIAAYTSIFAGGGGTFDGVGTATGFPGLGGITSDPSGNLYVTDWSGCDVRKITTAAVVTTIAGLVGPSNANGYQDGTGTNARFGALAYLTYSRDGNLYVPDQFNFRVRKVTTGGVVTTFAGQGSAGKMDGYGTNAQFTLPQGIVSDTAANLYVCDADANTIRMITPIGLVTTIAGSGTAGNADGVGNLAQINRAMDITIDTNGILYVASTLGNNIRKISPSSWAVTTFVGSSIGAAGYADGVGTSALFTCNSNMCMFAMVAGTLYVTERSVNRIRRVTSAGGVTTLAGSMSGSSGSSDGVGTAASFSQPLGLAASTDASILFVCDGVNKQLRKISIATSTQGARLF